MVVVFELLEVLLELVLVVFVDAVVEFDGVLTITGFCGTSTGCTAVWVVLLDITEFGFVGLIGLIGLTGLFIFVAVIIHVLEVVAQSDHVGVEYGSEQLEDLFCMMLPVYPGWHDRVCV